MKLIQIPALVCMLAFSLNNAEAAPALDKILPVETAAEIAGFPAADAKVSYKPDAKHPETDVIYYSWDNGRIDQRDILKTPLMDMVQFGLVKKSDLASIKEATTDKETPTDSTITAIKSMSPVDGVGEYAVWNLTDKQLIVLHKGREFSVWVNVSPDGNVNKAKAIELAKKLLEAF